MSASNREDLSSKRYLLDKPPSVYPLDGLSTNSTIYPDFKPWIYSQESPVSINSLQKGYFEPPIVNNEYLSARNLMNQIFLDDSIYKNLSSYISKSVNLKQINNKVSPVSNFKPPPRVTLTEQKKEQWLKDLANPFQPLKKLSRTIPHGIRNKILIEQLVLKNVPIKRAVWLTKCICINELRSLKRKKNDFSIELGWFNDWTEQILEYLVNFSKEMIPNINNNLVSHKEKFNLKLNYLLNFTINLYLNEMMNRELFLNSILNFLKNDNKNLENNFEVFLIGLAFLNNFWNFFLKNDTLSKKLVNILSINYYNLYNDVFIINKLNLKLKDQILSILREKIIFLFKFNSNLFIIPKNWNYINSILFNILNDLNNKEIMNHFELINYRNESLMVVDNNFDEEKLGKSADHKNLTQDFNSFNNLQNVKLNKFQILLSNLDQEKFNYLIDYFKEKENLNLILMWLISDYRNFNIENILIVCNFLKKKSSNKIFKSQLEDEILGILFNLNNIKSIINFEKLFILINELYQLNLFTISSYLRKIISSGVNIDESGEIYNGKAEGDNLHIEILKNLPILNGNKSNFLLKKLNYNDNDINFTAVQKIMYEKLIKNLLIENTLIVFTKDESIFFQNLKVGVKFLIINWLIKEVKDLINDSNQLIHINLEKLSIFYEIFKNFDNLTIFFKDLINFLLANENQIIIIYLDSLYFICFLICENFKLIQSLNLLPRLIKLVLKNYNNLKNTDFDFYKFNYFWKISLNYIENNIENSELRSEFKDKQDNQEIERVINDISFLIQENFKFYLSNKKILTILKKQNLSLPNFNANLNLEHESINLTNDLPYIMGIFYSEELPTEKSAINYNAIISSLGRELDMNISNDEDADDDEYDNDEDEDDEDDDLFNDNDKVYDEFEIIKLMKVCQMDQVQFNLILSEFLMEIVHNKEIDKQSKFLIKLLINEFINFKDLILILIDLKENGLIVNMIFHQFRVFDDDEKNDSQFGLSYFQITKLKLLRRSLFENDDELILNIIKTNFNILYTNYNYKLVKMIKILTINNINLVLNNLLKNPKIDSNNLLSIYNEILNLEVPLSKKEQLVSFLGKVNEFNLPFFQILIKLVFENSPETKSDQLKDEIIKLINDFLINFNCSNDNINFIDLFKFLNSHFKYELLYEFELIFLDNDKFPRIVFEYKNLDLVPILKNFFKNFLIANSDSDHSVIETSAKFYHKLRICLDKLVKICQDFNNKSFINTNYNKDEIYDCIYIFLRILIIHKGSLVALLRNDLNFIDSLVSLFNLEFINDDEKLKVLFYDILLLFKNSLIEYNSEQNSQVASNLGSPDSAGTSTHSSTSSSIISQLFKLPEMNLNNPLKQLLRLNANSKMIDNSDEILLKKFMTFDKQTGKTVKFTLRPFDLLEDSNAVPQLNDTPINLNLFGAVVDKQNPP